MSNPNGGSVSGLLKVVSLKSDDFRKTMNTANEKGRSVGTNCEELAESCQKCAEPQLSCSRDALLAFAKTIGLAERARKSLYQRVEGIGKSALVEPARGTKSVNQSMAAFNKHIKARPSTEQNLAAQSSYSTVMSTTRQWMSTYNTDMRRTMRDYAHAQMEFSARALEAWSNFMQYITIIDFNEDTDKMVSMLEEGAQVQTGEKQPGEPGN